jgi:hypothetical protein
MTKPKKAKKKVRGGPHPQRAAYSADPGKLAIGSAVGAAIGALAGAAFVRNPNLYNDMMKQFGEMLVNPTLHNALRSLSTSAVAEESRQPRVVAMHPPGGCGIEGCPTNNPHAFAEEEARVSQENPTWTHTQVQMEVSKRLLDQAERAHLAAEPPRRKSRAKKNNSSEPEETSN